MRWSPSVGVAAGAVAAVAVAGGLWWQASRAEPEPFDLAALEEAVAALHSARGSEAELCALAASQGNCGTLLGAAGPAPAAAPEIVCVVDYAGDPSHAAGQVVRIHVDGVEPDTETMVLRDSGTPTFMNPVYWGGAGVSTGDTASADRQYWCGPS
ncbi:hypothetical protein [Demequina silvatica]|uniref:hypothetical protein n=1 Tax=Demequina silvatica TaxID=1638988 RepID=UPI000780ECF3|nr:hypothetical protein [Demequina silvatica]